jgi:hypothetical protein
MVAQPNRYTATAVARTPLDALAQAHRTMVVMIAAGGQPGPVVAYTATVEASSTTPAVLGDQPVDVVTEYAATVTVQHLPEKP